MSVGGDRLGQPPHGAAGQRRPEAIQAIPIRHPWRWVAAVAVLLLASLAIYTFASAPDLHWSVVGQFLFFPRIMQAVVVTLELTVLAMLIGISLGVVLAVMRLSVNPVMSSVSWFYIWFFRGTPVLVQIFFWFNIATILPVLRFGIPFTSIQWVGITNSIVSPFLAAVLGLGFNEAAYMSEVVRAGIISVDQGQTEAAQALGMTRIRVMRQDRPATGDAGDHPADRERDDLDAQDVVARVHRNRVRAVLRRRRPISNFNYDIIELLIVASASGISQ